MEELQTLSPESLCHHQPDIPHGGLYTRVPGPQHKNTVNTDIYNVLNMETEFFGGQLPVIT